MTHTLLSDILARSVRLSSRAGRIQAILILAAVYFLAAKLGLSLALLHTSATAVWPPSGIALAAVLRLGYWVWPGITLGAFVANLSTTGNVLSSTGIAAGNTLEALAGAWLMHRFTRGTHAFERPGSIVLYVVLVAGFSTAISSTVGLLSLAAGGLVTLSRAAPVWFTWWMGDAISMLTVAPAILVWGSRPTFHASGRRVLEAAALLAAVLVTGQMIFGTWAPEAMRPYLVPTFGVPVLLWAAFRFDQRGAASATLLLAMLALQGTLQGHGPLSPLDEHGRLLVLQGFIGMVAVTGLVVASVVSLLTQSLTEKEILLREIHHRVKNNLQVISSLLSLQQDVSGKESAWELLQDSQSRIQSMALIHECLYGSSDLARVDARAYLARLIDYLRSVYARAGQPVTCELEADDVGLSVDAAVPCGLIVNELVCNALTHAFPDGRTGNIRVSLRSPGVGRYVLEVKDNGIGAPANLSGEAGGLGLRLVRALSEQLGGVLSVNRSNGTAFAVTFADKRENHHGQQTHPGHRRRSHAGTAA